MENNLKSAGRYQVTVYDGSAMTVKTVSGKEKNAFKPEACDLYYSPPDGVLAFRDADGNWVEYRGQWPRFGPKCIGILQAILLNPGDFLTPAAIAELTAFESLRENTVLAARVFAMRKSLRDPGTRFVETRTSNGYAIRWPRGRSFLWIELIPSAL
jgi:hypothetical protein